MKQNQFIQSCMQNYMKNCQHYSTGDKTLISDNILGKYILFTCCLSALGMSTTNPMLSYIMHLQCMCLKIDSRSKPLLPLHTSHAYVARYFRPA